MLVAKQVLQKCDIFGQQVNLNYKKEDTHKTCFGGFASAAIIVVLIVFFQSNVITFFSKTQIATSTHTLFDASPDEIILNEDNYMIALSIQQSNFSTNPYFNITAQQYIYTRLENGTQIKTSSYLNLIPCTFDRFERVFKKYNVDFKEQYNTLGFDTWLCPDYNFSIIMKGVYASQQFEFLKFIVTDCSNNTSKNSFLTWKPVCQSKEAINKSLSTSSVFNVQLYMTNLVINPSLPVGYATAFLDDELYFSFTPKQLSRQANIFWRKYDFQTDESLTPFENIVNNTYFVRSPTDFRDLTQIGTATDSSYAVFYLRRSTYTENVFRSYEKVDDLMSYLGGFLQIMIAFFGFFVQIYNKQSQLVDLSNELFDFDIDDGRNDINKNEEDINCQKADSISVRNRSQSIKDMNKPTNMKKSVKSVKQSVGGVTSAKQLDSVKDFTPLSQLTINNQKLIDKHQTLLQQLNVKNGRQYFQEQITNVFTVSKKLTFTMTFFIQKIFCERMMKNPQILLLNKAVNQINTELDIFGILEKLHEIDKLKELLLKKPQQIIFNFTPRPLISLRETKQLPSRQKAITLKSSQKLQSTYKLESSLKIGLDSVSRNIIQQKDEFLPKDSQQYLYSKLFKAYEQIMKLIENEDEDIYLNNQLIRKLGPSVQSIFEISWLLNQQKQNDKEIEVNDRARKLISSKFSKFKNPQQQQQQEESDGECSIQDIEILCSPKASDQQHVLGRIIGKRNSNEF